MRTGERCPILEENTPVKDVILFISEARAGAALITDKKNVLTGIFTDGDLRRHLKPQVPVLEGPVKEVMTANPKVITQDISALEAVGILKKHMIGDLPVVDKEHQPVGLLDLKDLVNIGLLDL